MHSEIGEGYGNRDRHAREDQEIFAEETPQIEDARPEDFSDADLFGALLRDEGRQGEKAQTGDKDSETGEGQRDAAQAGLGREFLRIAVIVKRI